MKKLLFSISTFAFLVANIANAQTVTYQEQFGTTNSNVNQASASQSQTAQSQTSAQTTNAAASAQATAPTPGATATQQSQPKTQIIPQLVQQIQQAKQMLQTVHLNYAVNPHYKKTTVKIKGKRVSKTVLSNYTLDLSDAAFAILNPATNQIEITAAMQNGRTFVFPDKNYDLALVSYNGVNSRFKVNKPAGGTMLAWKTLLSRTESGSRDAIVSSLSEAIYVPYEPELNTPEVASYGQNYINNVIKAATLQLQNVASVSQPGVAVPQAVKPTIIKALLYAEHMDTYEFNVTPDTQTLVNKLDTLYAGNAGDTFKYSVSSANARGIAQFIPGTYASLVRRHPDANLIPDFVSGMSDHVNAVKAEYLLIDDYIAAVRNSIPNDFNPAFVYDYGAASYNGGVARVAKAVQAFGQNWYGDQSAQLNATQLQISGIAAQVASLKKQIKAEKTKSAKADLNAQLATANSQLSGLKNQLASQQNSSLRNETIAYLNKMHRLIQLFNGEDQLLSISSS